MKKDQKMDLKEAIILCLFGIFLPDTWDGFGKAIADVFFTLVVLVVRVIVLLTFPVSIPLMYWLIRRTRKETMDPYTDKE